LDIEKRCNEFEAQDQKHAHDINVAQITLAFNNAKIIEFLRERGENIMNEKWGKLKDVN